MKKLMQISEDTLLPISLVIVLVGGVFWLSSAYSQISANAADIADIKQERETLTAVVSRIDRRLSRIEGRLKIKGREEYDEESD